MQLLNAALDACTSNPIILRLSGHTQTTDRLAMREIAYQLTHQTGLAFNIPNDQEGEGPTVDASPDEQVDFTPPAAYLPALVSQLTSLKRPVVVALDAFDLFVAHPRQALLYCLLDTAQSCRAGDGRNGLLVVGASCVVNCVNYLEKRVKSRFSHRILKVANPSTIEEYTRIARRLLSTPLDDTEARSGNTALAEWRELWKTAVEVRFFLSNDELLR
jgi:origin recognition complex subunit 4